MFFPLLHTSPLALRGQNTQNLPLHVSIRLPCLKLKLFLQSASFSSTMQALRNLQDQPKGFIKPFKMVSYKVLCNWWYQRGIISVMLTKCPQGTINPGNAKDSLMTSITSLSTWSSSVTYLVLFIPTGTQTGSFERKDADFQLNSTKLTNSPGPFYVPDMGLIKHGRIRYFAHKMFIISLWLLQLVFTS